MNHSPQPKGNGEQEGWKPFWGLLPMGWTGLSVQRNAASQTANGHSNPNTVQENGYRWDPTANVLLIQSWDKVFGRPPPSHKRHFENSYYLRYLQKMQQKLAEILLHIISRSVASVRRGRRQEHSHSSILLSQIEIQITEAEVLKNLQIVDDFNGFIGLFQSLNEYIDGGHQHNSQSDSASFVMVERPIISRKPHDQLENSPLVFFKARARQKVKEWLDKWPPLTQETREILRQLNFKPSEKVPINVLMELASEGLVPFAVGQDASHTWSELIDGGEKQSKQPERSLNTRELSHEIEAWLSKHKISKETAAAIRNAERHPESNIPQKVLDELKQNHAFNGLFIQDKNMTWAELNHVIDASLRDSL